MRQIVINKLVLLQSILLFVTTAFAQRGSGRILGTGTDTSGAVVPGATVTITNVATHVETTTVTNDSGYFTMPNLQVGSYSVAVTKDGFKKRVRSGLTLEV
jgi:hypothetical protein